MLMRETKGITLIALVVTIIVLLILAGITISLVFSDNGIIAKAREAANKTNQATIDEQVEMSDATDYMSNMLNGIGGDIQQVTPDKPTVDYINNINGFNGVEVVCTNQSHVTKWYLLGDKYCIISDVEGNINDGYNCNIEILIDEYVSEYSDDIMEEHTLNSTAQPLIMSLKWKGDKWVIDGNEELIITVDCT